VSGTHRNSPQTSQQINKNYKRHKWLWNRDHPRMDPVPFGAAAVVENRRERFESTV